MIKRIQIENFKSFGKVDLEPHPRVNLLIGPNSSGKSNFLEALQLGLGNPTSNEGSSLANWTRFQNSATKSDFQKIQVSVTPFWIDKKVLLTGRQVLFLKDQYLTVENLYGTGSEFIKLHFKGDKTPGSSDGIEPNFERFKMFEIKNSSVIQFIRPELRVVRNPFGTVQFDYPNQDFSNLGPLIYHLMNKHFESYLSMCRTLKELTGEFDRVTIPNIDGNFKIQFDSNSSGPRLVEDVSDGILYFTCILAILHQPNPPKVILLEEPENGIHPRRIVEIMSMIWKLAEEKEVQFFITTHSPIILDQFAESPECVWVFDKKDGISQIQNLEKIIEAKHEFAKANGLPPVDYTAELSENWLWGLLDGVPPPTQI